MGPTDSCRGSTQKQSKRTEATKCSSCCFFGWMILLRLVFGLFRVLLSADPSCLPLFPFAIRRYHIYTAHCPWPPSCCCCSCCCGPKARFKSIPCLIIIHSLMFIFHSISARPNPYSKNVMTKIHSLISITTLYCPPPSHDVCDLALSRPCSKNVIDRFITAAAAADAAALPASSIISAPDTTYKMSTHTSLGAYKYRPPILSQITPAPAPAPPLSSPPSGEPCAWRRSS